ncbi:MAG: GNAT family N-acetyltransferase [Oscillospiraceae bacterium]|nr:GNAT family N-acetyltransferase [Clostridia bacterium]MBQ6427766.1 GNAT family N-acetyltransferase [Oscillospiraceae bacterium]
MIETERLRLREYTPDDFDALYGIVSDPETMAHYPAPFDEARTRRWIDWNLENYAQYGFGLWAVVLRETGEFIGDCGLTLQNIDGEMLPEIGYHIHKKYWRRGFAKEAARAVRDWAFLNTEYNALYSYMKYTNEGSWRTAMANGMKKVKEYPDPKNEISYAFAITRDEWKKLTILERFTGMGCAWLNAAGEESAEYFGTADREANIAVNGDTIFPACSISKFVTAICVMKLREQKMIDIDEPVNDYLGQWKLCTPEGSESDATVRALLCHTAGIRDGEAGFCGLRRGNPEIRLIDILEGRTAYNDRPARAEKPQGTAFEYSDAGYCVLQLMLQERMRMPFEDIARELVFDPLGLRDTFFASPENAARFEGRVAAGYDEDGLPVPGKYLPVPDLAASGLWSTPKELLIIAKAFIGVLHGEDALLQAESAREMARPANDFPWTGLGVFTGGEDILVAQGWGENGQCMMKMNTRTKRIAVVMANQNPGVDQAESGIEWLVDRKLNET